MQGISDLGGRQQTGRFQADDRLDDASGSSEPGLHDIPSGSNAAYTIAGVMRLREMPLADLQVGAQFVLLISWVPVL
jgi:hypothetical protein